MESLIGTGGKGGSQQTTFDHERKKRSVKIFIKIQPLDIVTSSVEDRPVIRIHIIKTTRWEEEHLPDERTIIINRSIIEGKKQLRE